MGKKQSEQTALSILQSLGERIGIIPRGTTLDDEAVISAWEGSTDALVQGIQKRLKTMEEEELVRNLLRLLGEDPDRGGLHETPTRFLKAMRFYCSGYAQDPASVMKCFEDGADGVDELVCVTDIPFYSLCEHHMAPFFGKVHIGYIPKGKVLGLSKFARLVEIFARRLQVQERLTNQIANAIQTYLDPMGCGVVIKASHLCMECRGVQKIGAKTTTSALRGVVKDKPEARAEFLSFVRNGK